MFFSDFSNGFLVAEIFSRYYERDVSMHSFSNGMNTTMRADNWRQLLTLFEKLGFEFDNKLAIVQNIMTHTDGPGSAKGPTANREETRGISYLLERIYEFLTHRKICSRVHEKGANKVKLKPKARSVDTKRSNGTAAESVLEEYKVDPAPSKREEQAHEYSSSSRTPRVMKGETRTVEKADSVQQVSWEQLNCTVERAVFGVFPPRDSDNDWLLYCRLWSKRLISKSTVRVFRNIAMLHLHGQFWKAEEEIMSSQEAVV